MKSIATMFECFQNLLEKKHFNFLSRKTFGRSFFTQLNPFLENLLDFVTTRVESLPIQRKIM